MKDSSIIKELSVLLSSLANLLWPVIFASILYVLRHPLYRLLSEASEFNMEIPGGKFQIKPSSPPKGGNAPALPPLNEETPLPFDYLYLNHTSFLRIEKQAEFKARTHIDLPHYDIRVVVDSYYEGAVSRITKVEYYLHQAFPQPIQVRTNLKDRFLLKELANGEFVIQAKVFIVGRKAPILLQRYLTLWKEGPRLE